MAVDMNDNLKQGGCGRSSNDDFECEVIRLDDDDDDDEVTEASENNQSVEETSDKPIAEETASEASPEGSASEETASDAGEGTPDSESESSEDETEESSESDKDGKSGFLKKKDKKEKKDKRDEQIADLTDKLKRSMAEFENFRKRTDKEKSQMYEIGASDVISKILPVIDNFERGLSTITEEQKSDPIASGMELIYKQLMTALTDMGVTQIPALNEQFDPNLHNAVMHVEDESVGENIVVEEFQKGYKYRDGIVRHSMVKVAN